MNARCPTCPICRAACATLTTALILIATQPAAAQPGWVKSHQKISDTEGGFTGTLDDDDRFGTVASLGDLDGDGVTDLAVGSVLDDDGGRDRGAVWVLFLDGDGSGDGQSVIDSSNSGACGGGMCGAMGMLCRPLTLLSLMAMRRRRVRTELRE